VFQKEILPDIHELSHKIVYQPTVSHYSNHIHHYCEILLFISGDVDFNINGQIYTPKPYDLLFIPDQTYHNLIPRSEKTYENYVIGFEKSFVDDGHYNTIFSSPAMTSIRDNAELIGIFKTLDLSLEIMNKKDFETCASAAIKQILLFCSYLTKETSPAVSVNPVTENIVSYIIENLTQELNAQIIADNLMFSKSYIQNIFDQTMHIGLKQYIRQQKLYAAYNEIHNGSISPSQACQKYAFRDYSSFYRQFKKTFGVSPKEVIGN